MMIFHGRSSSRVGAGGAGLTDALRLELLPREQQLRLELRQRADAGLCGGGWDAAVGPGLDRIPYNCRLSTRSLLSTYKHLEFLQY